MSPRDLLKLLMKQRGINPTRLATAAGNRSIQAALSRWLSNPNHDIRPRTLAPIARVLDVPLEALLTQHAATRYAIENGLLPQQQTGDGSAAPCGAIVSVTQPRQEPLPLAKAIERTREALRKVPPGQRLEVTSACMKKPCLQGKFQRNLKRAMDHRGIKQQQLAAVADVGQSSVGRILRGEQSPTLDIVEQLAAALGFDPWMLLVDDFTPDSALGLKAISPEEEALYDRLRLAAQDLAKFRSGA